jgi:putative membrane protein
VAERAADFSGSILGAVLLTVLVRWVVLAFAFAITSWLLSGMNVSGGVWAYLWIAALFGIVNAILGTLLRWLTLPLMVVTLGLFSIIVNAALLKVIDAISSQLTIDHFFWTAIWAAIILAFTAVILDLIVDAAFRRQQPAIASM